MIATRMPNDDHDLMARAVKGDRAAFGALAERHAPRIARLAYFLLHDFTRAEDAVQETFARTLSGLATYRPDLGEPRAWLLAVALNVCRRLLRDERRTSPCDPRDLEEARRRGAPPRGVVTSVLRRETAAQVAIAMGHLTEAQREVFVLHNVEGLPYEEVARLLGLTTGAARSLSHRASLVLRDRVPPNILVARRA